MRNSIPFVLAVTMLLALALAAEKNTLQTQGDFRIRFPLKGYHYPMLTSLTHLSFRFMQKLNPPP